MTTIIHNETLAGTVADLLKNIVEKDNHHSAWTKLWNHWEVLQTGKKLSKEEAQSLVDALTMLYQDRDFKKNYTFSVPYKKSFTQKVKHLVQGLQTELVFPHEMRDEIHTHMKKLIEITEKHEFYHAQ